MTGQVGPAAQRPVRVIFFGDSICAGQYVSPHLTWVTAIAERLGKSALVMNASVNGNTTRMALERIAYDLQAHEPDLVVVQFGMNDCNVWRSDRGHPRVSERAFVANLIEIVDRSRRFGARQVVLDTNHPSPRNDTLPGTSETYRTRNATYNQLIRSVAAEIGDITLADVESMFAGPGESLDRLLLPDGVHLGPLGHRRYVEVVGPVVEAAVARLATWSG